MVSLLLKLFVFSQKFVLSLVLRVFVFGQRFVMGLLLRVFVFGQSFLRGLLLMGFRSRPKVRTEFTPLGSRLRPSTCSKSKGGPNGREGRGGAEETVTSEQKTSYIQTKKGTTNAATWAVEKARI